MHANLVGTSRVLLDRFGVNVLAAAPEWATILIVNAVPILGPATPAMSNAKGPSVTVNGPPRAGR